MSQKGVRTRNLHPFPARMAPEIALNTIRELCGPDSVVLDPMCGSGTVPRLALMNGRRAVASDVDPLAVLMTRVSCFPSWSLGLAERAVEVVSAAELLDDCLPDWIASDPETERFSRFWFADVQHRDLSRLARVLSELPQDTDPLRVALSRIIVTKNGGASLARDTSHSRPHRVTLQNSFCVFSEFVKASKTLEHVLVNADFQESADVQLADARILEHIGAASVDLIVTSPPYLNAIDYLRGHRMSLIWLGWTMSQLREIRGESIGTERKTTAEVADLVHTVRDSVLEFDSLPSRELGIVFRFANDLQSLSSSLSRVSKPGSHMVLVVADSTLKGVQISNSALAIATAESSGYRLRDSHRRPIPTQHRYLPPPESGRGALGARMREEIVLTFQRAG